MLKVKVKVKVEQLTSPKSGRPVANQFLIYTNEGVYFQSYDSVIAFRDTNGQVTLDETYWDYSKTTHKYRNLFLREDTATTKKKINAGIYKLADLNRGV